MPSKSPKTASLEYEREYAHKGYTRIVGIDEVGRGTWAGPVVAGAVCYPVTGYEALLDALQGVYDSKALSARQRETVQGVIKRSAVAWGIGMASVEEIDHIGIAKATQLAMARAVSAMQTVKAEFEPDCLLLDTLAWKNSPFLCPHVCIRKGDQRSVSIASASILAKIWRDALMTELGAQYPQYEFERHKGYGTSAHIKALDAYGVSPIHRRSYKPIKARLEQDTLL